MWFYSILTSVRLQCYKEEKEDAFSFVSLGIFVTDVSDSFFSVSCPGSFSDHFDLGISCLFASGLFKAYLFKSDITGSLIN